MFVLTTLFVIGLLQTLFVAANFQGRWLASSYYCALPGVATIAVSGWVEHTNFIRLNDFLISGTTTVGLASVLIMEAILKILGMIDRNGISSGSVHWWLRICDVLSRKAQSLVVFLPSIMLLLFIYYAQSYLFHTIESYSFRALSLLMAFCLTGIFAAGIALLRMFFSKQSFDGISYDLLFLQFAIAIILPVLTKDSIEAAPLYDLGIYVKAAGTCAAMFMLIILGYGIRLLIKQAR